MNKKGFVFIETVVVIAIISSLLVLVYSSFNIIIKNEKKRNKYDQTSYLYRVNIIKNFLEQTNNYAIVDNMNGKSIVQLTCNNTNLYDNNDYSLSSICNNYVKSFNINKMYISENRLETADTNDTSIVDYVNKKIDDINNRYLLVIKFNDGNISSLHFNVKKFDSEVTEDTKKNIKEICLNKIQLEDSSFHELLFNDNSLLKEIISENYINCSTPSLDKVAVDSKYITFGSIFFGDIKYTPYENYIYFIKDYEASYSSAISKGGLYFRGINNNNYVKFVGKDDLWRIMKINNDGSIKIVLDDPKLYYDRFPSTLLSLDKEYINKMIQYPDSFEYGYKGNYGETGESESFNYINANLLQFYDYYFTENSTTIVDSNFCIDQVGSLQANSTYNSPPFLFDEEEFKCPKVFKNKIGLLTIYDVNVAGATKFFKNDAFYLYNANSNNNILTFSFYRKEVKDNKINSFSYFVLEGTNSISGSIGSSLVYYYLPSAKEYLLKPVVTLKNGISFTSGNGSHESPYEVVIQ